MPHKRPIVEYSDGQFQFKVLFTMYADFESILEPIQGPGNNPRTSTTRDITFTFHLDGTFAASLLTRYLQYLDANNLYGWAMSQPLPTGGFRWVDIKPDEISTLVNSSEKGYLLSRYPRELHDYHNDLPFMCKRMVIGRVEKLVPNLYYKKRYVIHIRALDQALKHGLVLERIHRAIEFNSQLG